MPYFQRDNFKIHYLDHFPENKKTILLLHGLGSNGDAFQPQIQPLARAGYRVITPDMRGFGKSGYPEKLSIQSIAEDTAALIKNQTSSPVDLLGISMGGTVALQLALDSPKLVNTLVLVNTFGRLRPSKPGVWFYLILRLILVHTIGIQTQAKTVSQRIFPHPDQAELRKLLEEQIHMSNPKAYRASMRAMGRFDVIGQLSQIKQPTLVISGEEDTTVLVVNQQILADAIPRARRIAIANGGHAVSIDQADAFNAVLLGFLSKQEKRT
jgi:pimeloyl-ACP methyl ester carboxylesterase